ncbi:two-component system response regulator, OmpR family [Dehalogenimonas formicexedens]|uniref:Two-component system response regulator, OmpR family n=1 Tax=Dehalogenimonas formicexedens TaxID=1839801 RepID=A0A1P8F5G9_9CHLR|nr:response regulator transcription factor [Dehalogenimonas formicexedens]APV43713.1 two-component system response regulator, OmpR family [Dehalogenimonas formicexedens]
MRVLIVENFQDDVIALVSTLKIPWPEVEITRCTSGTSGLAFIEKEQFDLFVIDLDLPDMSGFDFIESVFLYCSKPTIVIRKNLTGADIVRSLQLGADECFSKPFDPLSFIAKTQALIRRYSGKSQLGSMVIGKLRLDTDIHRAYVDGQEIALTRNENLLMHRLMQNYGQVTSYSSIERAIWGNFGGSGNNSALRGCVKRLKKKFPQDSSLRIVTEHGTGFKLVGIH